MYIATGDTLMVLNSQLIVNGASAQLPYKVRFRPPLALVPNTSSHHRLASDLIYCSQQPRGWQQTTCPNPPCYLLAPPRTCVQLYRLGLSICHCQEVVSSTIPLLHPVVWKHSDPLHHLVIQNAAPLSNESLHTQITHIHSPQAKMPLHCWLAWHSCASERCAASLDDCMKFDSCILGNITVRCNTGKSFHDDIQLFGILLLLFLQGFFLLNQHLFDNSCDFIIR